MITLIEFFDVAMLPMIDMGTGKKIDSKVVLKHPDAVITNIGFNWRTLEFTVEYIKEPKDAEDD